MANRNGNAKNKRKNTKNTGEPYHSQALVKQLKDLCLDDDDDVLKQILTSAEPEPLSELTAAHNGKSMIPLFTEKEGRKFFILAGLSAYSNWDGQYPMEFSPTTKCTRKLSDPTLADKKITSYQNDALKEILTAVCATEDAVEFRKPLMVYRLQIWDNYKALIAEPIDLETMELMLYHNRYTTVWGFRRHVDLLEDNARKYNGKRNPSIVAAAIKVRSDIYRRMDEVPAEPPLRQHGVSMARRIIHANDHGSASAAGSVVGASHEEASISGAGARRTDCTTFFLPLGRLGVARNSGDEEIIPTPYIVVMSLESCDKPLWLYKDNYTPVGLPSDKKTLLDFGGQYNFTTAKLADGIDEWKPLSGRGCRGSKGKKVPALCWERVKDLVRKTSQDKAVLLDVVEDRQQAKAAIQEGWGISPESSESSESEQLNGFVVGDSDPGDSDSDHSSDSDDTNEESGASDDSEPPRKRSRPAIPARYSFVKTP